MEDKITYEQGDYVGAMTKIFLNGRHVASSHQGLWLYQTEETNQAFAEYIVEKKGLLKKGNSKL